MLARQRMYLVRSHQVCLQRQVDQRLHMLNELRDACVMYVCNNLDSGAIWQLIHDIIVRFDFGLAITHHFVAQIL